MSATTAMRAVLGVAGIALIGIGVVVGLGGIALDDRAGVLAWLALAVVVHDGIIAPIVAAAALGAAPVAARIGPMLTGISRALLTVAAIASLIALPGILVRARGPRNDSIHSIDYLVVLGVIWLIALVGALVCVVLGARRHPSPAPVEEGPSTDSPASAEPET